MIASSQIQIYKPFKVLRGKWRQKERELRIKSHAGTVKTQTEALRGREKGDHRRHEETMGAEKGRSGEGPGKEAGEVAQPADQ